MKTEDSMKTEKKEPILIITDERWSQIPYVIFDEDELEPYIELAMHHGADYDDDADIEDIRESIEDDIWTDNTVPDEILPGNVIRAGANYYLYHDTGEVRFIKNIDDLPEEAKKYLASL